LENFISVREYFRVETPFSDGHAMLDNIIDTPPSGFAAKFRPRDRRAIFNL